MKMTTDFAIEYSGDTHELDINILLTSLLNFNSALQEIQLALAPEVKMEVKVRPFERGSFLVNLGIDVPDVIHRIGELFRHSVPLADNIVSVFAGVITIKKFLGSKPAKSITETRPGETTIINDNGQQLNINAETVNIYFSHPKVEAAINNSFRALDSDDRISGVKVLDKERRDLVEVSQESFPEMAMPARDADGDRREATRRGVYLQAYKLSFEPGVKWSFLFDGNKITASISDEEFYKRINNNEAFARGDVFVVELKIVQEFDKSVQGYVNKSYEITQVLEHRRAPTQSELDFEDGGA